MPQCKSLIFSHRKLFGRPPFYPELILATFINFCSGSRRSTLGVVPSLIPIYQFEFLSEFYFIILFFIIALFTIQLKRKDGSVGSFPFQAQRLHSTTLAASPAKPRDVAPAAESPATPPLPPLPPTLPHPLQVLPRGRGLELRQADTPSLSSGR